MNGFTYPSRGMADERQPPQQSIPPLSQLQFHRSETDASPSPSQLPPLAGHHNFPPYQNGLQRPAGAPLQQPPAQFGGDKTANLSQIAPHQSLPTSQAQQYPPFVSQYSSAPPQIYPPVSAANGASGNGQYYPPIQQQPPPYVEPSHQSNLLPPFNPQQPVQGVRQNDRPTPVVGSQGRRGILPSAPGRASAVGTAAAVNSKDAVNNTVRRADGKYECQFCNKSYLHLKHLKRHHLRHTGERPYQCYLCQETFCRSDILKRHFQKCSIRRGNPTGAGHLTHAQAHLRRGSQPPPPQQSQIAPANPPMQQAPPSSYRPGWAGPALAHEQPVDSNRSSRSSSVVHRPGSSTEDPKSFTGMQTANTSLDTSPSSNSGERKYSAQYPYSRDLPPAAPYHEAGPSGQPSQPGAQYPNYYGSNPQQFSTSQSESFPAFPYNQPNGYRYVPYEGQPPGPEPTYNHYQQFFQPGSQDPVMSYHQQ